MYRSIEIDLMDWKNNKIRKPLLLNGMRQVGKTWILKKFGEKHYPNVHYFNFDNEPKLCDVFKTSKDPEKIIRILSITKGIKIAVEDLIIFDEIQECNEALNALKYFCESDTNYHVVGAGSYLGITLSKGSSFPVGKVDIVKMYPMTFKEFLKASGEDMLVDYLGEVDLKESIPEPIFDKLSDLFRQYYIIGGMPEVVAEWIEHEDINSVSKLQKNILNAYRSDFSKYAPRNVMPKILDIWDSVVGQLSNENKKFKYSQVRKSARSREYEEALNWLVSGNYFHKNIKVKVGEIPLTAYTDLSHFKIYLSDIGLLRAKADFPPSYLFSENASENVPFKGALAENVVLQELVAKFEKDIFYWADKSNHELDFMIQLDTFIVPIEVKFGKNVKSSSLSKYLKDHPDAIGVRFSMKNLKLDSTTLNIPLFMVSELERLYRKINIT